MLFVVYHSYELRSKRMTNSLCMYGAKGCHTLPCADFSKSRRVGNRM